MSEDYKNLKVKDLQELLQKNGIPHSGKKEDLIERLVKHDERKAMESLEKEFELEDDFDESKINLEDIPTEAIFTSLILEKPTIYEKESVLSDDEEEFKSVAETVLVTEKEDVIANTTSPSLTAADSTVKDTKVVDTTTTSSFKFTPITFESKTPPKNTTTKAKTTTTKNINKKSPVPKVSQSKVPVAKTKAAVTKNNLNKTIPTARKATSSVVTKAIRPTRSTKLPIPKVTKSTKVPKVSSAASTTASLAIQDKKAQPTPEQIEKLRVEAERKLERSKRFGIKLDEKDMKEIRAARFGITPVVVQDKNKPVIKKAEPKKKIEPAKKAEATAIDKNTTAQDILKKRAERFGIPEKKIVPVKNVAKKPATKPNVNQKINGTKTHIVPKTQVKQGRVQKMGPKTVLKTKKTITVAVTKSNILNKKKTNITARLTGTTLAQNKRVVINNRKVNVVNNNTKQNDRVITFGTPKTAPAQRMKTSARDIIINANNNIRRPANNSNNTNKRPTINNIGNGRTVTVAVAPSVSTPTNNKRRRGRGIEPAHQPMDKKRRN